MCQSIFDANIMPVIGAVLRNEDQFFYALIAQVTCFIQNGVHWARNMRPLDFGNRTKSTGAATAIGEYLKKQIEAPPMRS